MNKLTLYIFIYKLLVSVSFAHRQLLLLVRLVGVGGEEGPNKILNEI